MTFYSKDKSGVKVFHLLQAFFEEIKWGDEKSDFYYEDGLFVFEKIDLRLKTSEDYLVEIYEALEHHFKPLSQWGLLSGVRPLKLVHKEREAGKTREEIYFTLINSHKLAPKKARLLLEVLEVQEEIYRSDRDKLSLYISLPFCPSICSYCCFHTKLYNKDLANAYLQRLLEDLAYAKRKILEAKRKVDCIYLGGGTPWVIDEEDLEILLDSLSDFKELKEFTFEGGRVDGLSKGKAELVASRVTRVCLNPQTLSKGLNPLVGRPEAEGLDQWIHFFKNRGSIVASDLIAGLPGERLETFKASLNELISYKPDNITIHNLSLKKGASLKKLPHGDSVSSMLDEAYSLLKTKDYKPYYIYRQKMMVDRGENLGYETGGSPSIYNIRMMEDSHEILSLGSSAVSKKIREGELIRLSSPRDINLYIKEKDKSIELINNYFD